MVAEPIFISGGKHVDERGSLSFVNDFCLDEVKRLYIIEHPTVDIVRAWQGHKKEQKWFLVTAGSFTIFVVQPDNWEKPADLLETKKFVLSENSMGVLHVPGGHATGLKALMPDSKMIVYSDFTVEQSSLDSYRFDKALWCDWNKI
ncbi:WxcM-like domain-containing protein [Pedobacter nyackensis]|uniref:WxcM-like domain-containing protein n=1 Tax=Pedobacter nyackensis TaxID=475255 RepID=UPI00292F6556|nr:WxcM-like domain-containing protein [Pedobacter nyackensis]